MLEGLTVIGSGYVFLFQSKKGGKSLDRCQSAALSGLAVEEEG